MEETATTSEDTYELTDSRSNWNFSELFANYGWYLLLLAIALAYLYKKAQPTIEKYLKDKSDREYAAKYHKDPDMAAARLAAQQTAVQKLQEKYHADAVEYQRKLEEKVLKKREEWLGRQTTSGGEKLGSSLTKKDKQSLKPEYNPLTGGSSRSYRPQRKTPCSGGGCGK